MAHMLLHNGVKQGDYVGIFMKRSIDTVVSIIAVLKQVRRIFRLTQIIQQIECNILLRIANQN